MTRNNHSAIDDSTAQQEENEVRLETVEDKALEALKHDHPDKDCAVTVRVHNKDHDSDRNVTDHLIQTSEEWIAFSTWCEAPGETGIAIEDHGNDLQLTGVDLNQDVIANRILDEALAAIDTHEEVGRPVTPFTTLIRNVSDVTEDITTRWQEGSEYVVGERIHEGFAGWTGHIAWTAHEDEACYVEADRATTRFIDEHLNGEETNDIETTIEEILRQSLYDGIAEFRRRRTPHVDYAAKVTLTD